MLFIFPPSYTIRVKSHPSLVSNPAAASIQAEMVAVLFRQSTPVFFGNYVVSALFAFMLWSRADQSLLLLWGGAVFVLTAIRQWVARYYLRHTPGPQHALRWGWLMAVMSGLSGWLWGMVGLLFMLPEHPVTIVLVGFVLAGMVGGSVASLSAFVPAYYAYAIPAVAPFAIRSFMIGGELFSVLGILSLCLLGVNLYYSRVIWQTLQSSVQLRFENLALIQQLQQEKDRAESANQAKTHFLAAASHDLRQPVHALGLFAGTLHLLAQQAQPSREMLATIASRIQASLHNMGNLLNSLLDVSRLESGTVKVRLEPCPAQKLFDALENEFGATARNKGLSLRIVPSCLWVEADSMLLSRILSNILANAIRYTPSGGIVVGCRRRGSRVAFQVWDTGIGMDEQQLPHIFREFYQIENVARQQEQGLGLGLSIVKRSAALMHAAISVESMPGKGTVFSVELPRADTIQATVVRMQEGTNRAARTLAILLMDDQQAVLDATSALMTAWGHTVITARNIAEAVAAVERSGQRINLILADYRLEEHATGTDAIHAVNARLPQPAPAVIITGDTSPERIQEAAASGFTILHKPLSPEMLLQVIEDILE